MNNIQDLILKIRQKIWEKTPDSALIAEELSRILGIKIKEESLDLKKTVLFCRVSPIVKSEITLREKELLEAIQTITPKGAITSIR